MKATRKAALLRMPKFLERKQWSKKDHTNNSKFWDKALREESKKKAAAANAAKAKRENLLDPHPWEGETIKYRPDLNEGDRFAMNSLGWSNEVLDRLPHKVLQELLKHPRRMSNEDEEAVASKPALTKVLGRKPRLHLPRTEEQKAAQETKNTERDERKTLRHELGNKILAAIEDGSSIFTKIQNHTGLEAKNQIYQGLRYL